MSVALWNAVHHRDLAAVHAALQDVTTLTATNPERTKVFHRAATDFPEALPALLAAGVDVNTLLEGRTALRNVAESAQHLEQAELASLEILLAAGADPDIPDKRGDTPLHRFAWLSPSGSLLALKALALLLKQGANPNLINNDGETPLDLAYRECNGPAVRLLRQAGAQFHERPETTGYAEALILAVLENDAPEAQRLLSLPEADVEARDWMSGNALEAAAASGETAMARLLLAQGADVRVRDVCTDDDGTEYLAAPVLHMAAEQGHPEVVSLLLDAGADLESLGPSPHEYTPLIEAVLGAAFNHRSKAEAHATMRLLIERGANVRHRSQPYERVPGVRSLRRGDGSAAFQHASALLYAVWIGDPGEVEILLEAGAVQNHDELLEAMHCATLDNGRNNLFPLWQFGRRSLQPPLSLASAIPHIDGAGVRILWRACRNTGEAFPSNELDPATGDHPLATLLHLLRRHPSTWWMSRPFTYDTEDVARLLCAGTDPSLLSPEDSALLAREYERGLAEMVAVYQQQGV